MTEFGFGSCFQTEAYGYTHLHGLKLVCLGAGLESEVPDSILFALGKDKIMSFYYLKDRYCRVMVALKSL